MKKENFINSITSFSDGISNEVIDHGNDSDFNHKILGCFDCKNIKYDLGKTNKIYWYCNRWHWEGLENMKIENKCSGFEGEL